MKNSLHVRDDWQSMGQRWRPGFACYVTSIAAHVLYFTLHPSGGHLGVWSALVLSAFLGFFAILGYFFVAEMVKHDDEMGFFSRAWRTAVITVLLEVFCLIALPLAFAFVVHLFNPRQG